MDVSDIFHFFLLGEGKGERVAPGRGGGRFSIEKFQQGGGAGRVSAGNFGGELNIFFRGRNAHQVIVDPEKCFQETISETLRTLLRDRPCLELLVFSSSFLVSLFPEDKLLELVCD